MKKIILMSFFILIVNICFAEVQVITTIVTLSTFVKKIGGNHVSVTSIIPPGANPHSYEPTPGDMRKVSRADLLVKVGSSLEFEMNWLSKLLKLNKELFVCDASVGIQEIPMVDHDDHGEHHHHHGAGDPHIWLSPKNAILMVQTIKQSLIKQDPHNHKDYESNTKQFILELIELQEKIADLKKKIKNDHFLVYHPAWGYFCRDFGFKQIPIEIGGKEPTPKELVEVVKKAKEFKIKNVFIEPQFSKKGARVIANELGGSVVVVDPVSPEYSQSLLTLVQELANQ